MLKWMCAVALAGAAAGPAFAQKTDLPDRPVKLIKPFDQTPIKEGLTALKQGGQCTVQYIVGVDGHAKHITADCTVPEMAPYVTRTVQSGEWDSEITGGEFFDSFPIKQAFKFGTEQAVDPRGEKAPVLVTGLAQKDIERALARVDKEGSCAMKFTVGADGKAKDVAPNCEPAAFNDYIAEAAKQMKFEPGQKGGQPTEWPGLSTTVKLSKPKGS
ncbi:MAG: hypothetical protein EON61_23085 [Alphaproteobacteria bacterium]|nr:MAG: hypothetical protein EON61_23085 [Alphaproteobacteria bacterium]